MRSARRLGWLRLLTLVLVAAFGVIWSTTPLFAQEAKTCTGSGAGGITNPGSVVTCALTVATATIPAGGSLQTTVTVPSGVTVFCVAFGGFALGKQTAASECTFNTAVAQAPGVAAGTIEFTIPTTTPVGTVIQDQALSCSTQPPAACAAVAGPSVIGATGVGGTVSATPTVIPQPTNETKFCTNTASGVDLNQVVGGPSQVVGVSGPAISFTLPLFGGASTC